MGRIGSDVVGAISCMFSGCNYLPSRKQPCGGSIPSNQELFPGIVHTSSPYVNRYIRELIPALPVNLVFPLGVSRVKFAKVSIILVLGEWEKRYMNDSLQVTVCARHFIHIRFN